MNFLAHLYLARGDRALMLGGLLGDFVRGREGLDAYPAAVATGIELHRRIDSHTDRSPEVRSLKREFPDAFRRYAGIVIDLAFDHELARQWAVYCDQPLEAFDRSVRGVLADHHDLLPEGLVRFMHYADRRGLFVAYRNEEEMLFSLRGVGTRLSRPNPLHRVADIWPEVRPACASAFEQYFPRLQGAVAEWRRRRSTTTGS